MWVLQSQRRPPLTSGVTVGKSFTFFFFWMSTVHWEQPCRPPQVAVSLKHELCLAQSLVPTRCPRSCAPSAFPSRSPTPGGYSRGSPGGAPTDRVVDVGGPFGVLPPLPLVLAGREVSSLQQLGHLGAHRVGGAGTLGPRRPGSVDPAPTAPPGAAEAREMVESGLDAFFRV